MTIRGYALGEHDAVQDHEQPEVASSSNSSSAAAEEPSHGSEASQGADGQQGLQQDYTQLNSKQKSD